jgi:hypothetical protein
MLVSYTFYQGKKERVDIGGYLRIFAVHFIKYTPSPSFYEKKEFKLRKKSYFSRSHIL